MLRGSHDHGGDLPVTGHFLSNLTRTPPLVFLYLMKELASGSIAETKDFNSLEMEIYFLCFSSVHPAPVTFAVESLSLVHMFREDSKVLISLVITVFHGLICLLPEQSRGVARVLAAHLFWDVVRHSVAFDNITITEIIEMFEVSMSDINSAPSYLKWQASEGSDKKQATAFVKEYLTELIESERFDTVKVLLRHLPGVPIKLNLINRLLQSNPLSIVEKWCASMGADWLKELIRHFIPGPIHRMLRELCDKDLWDLAEIRLTGNRRRINYLACLAMEAGYIEKADELCEKYALTKFPRIAGIYSDGMRHQSYLCLKQLNIENLVWVDTVSSLSSAICYMWSCDAVGLDCESKPNYVRGSAPNKVAILQLATQKTVFVIDLIKLCRDDASALSGLLEIIFSSSRIFKLGYALIADIERLVQSYNLSCFKQYRLLLDLQLVFEDARGGLSGLSEKLLGAPLNRRNRLTNWEQRPLTAYQLEYAALDAAVLVHIFLLIRKTRHKPFDRIDWTDCIIDRWQESTMKQNAKRKCNLAYSDKS